MTRVPVHSAIAPGLAVLLTTFVAGCGGNQNTLEPGGRPENQIARLFWVMLAGAGVGLGVVVGLLLLGWWRRDRPNLPGGGGERAATRLVVVLGIIVPVVVLVALFVWADFVVTRATDAPAASTTALRIDVAGHDWWWEVRYPGTQAVTANEIHIPTRTRIDLVATTDDVIHSFWVPELNRKIDMIPGRSNRILLEADRPGRYRGQCSEFCGLQHAHMAIVVVAQPRRQFDAWLSNMSRPADAVSDPGARVFARDCASCHTIRGTSADGNVGPDLTHLASRRTLGAITLPNDPTHLRRWIRDAQVYKPGNRMPTMPLGGEDLRALVTYLEGLR
jgi:cytochrome c oxidase subunit II